MNSKHHKDNCVYFNVRPLSELYMSMHSQHINIPVFKEVTADIDCFCSDISRTLFQETFLPAAENVVSHTQSRVSAAVPSHMASSTTERSCLVQLLVLVCIPLPHDSEQSPQDNHSLHCVAECTTDCVYDAGQNLVRTRKYDGNCVGN